MPKVNREYLDPSLEALMEKVLHLRDEVARALEAARQKKVIGPSTEAEISFYPEDEEMCIRDSLCSVCIPHLRLK